MSAPVSSSRTVPIFLSVDLDSWVHSRWASGSARSFWPSSREAYRDVYGMDRPGRDFDEAMDSTLAILGAYKLRVTFFVLSEIATLYPRLMRQLDELGHELALHGREHVDNTRFTANEFRAMIRDSRNTLQDIIGKPVIGYRAANLILSTEQLVVLDQEGFEYDSSVCPSRRFFGKFANMTGAPTVPYHPSAADLTETGEMRILEFPLGVMPVVKLPCSTGIMTRVLGAWWGRIGTLAMLRKGYSLYYFHPYELGPKIKLPTRDLYATLSVRNCGPKFHRQLSSIFDALAPRGSFVRGCDLARAINKSRTAIGTEHGALN